MNNQPEQRPSKAEFMKRKRLATERKKKKQRQLILCAVIVILVIAAVAGLCLALILNKEKNPKDVGDDTTTAVTTVNKEKDEPDETDKPDQTTALTTADQTTAITTAPENDDTEITPESVIFDYTADGKIAGSPAAYADLIIRVNGSAVSASNYLYNYTTYLKGWYDALLGKATMNFTEGDGTKWFHLIFDGTDHDTRLGLRVNGSRISFGANSGMPQNIDAVSFSIGGISLGNTTEQVTKALGTPTATNDTQITYSFENGATLYFRLAGGRVSQIYLTMNNFTEQTS